MQFNDSGLIIALVVLFVVIGALGTVGYYFARYFFKTDQTDKEILTKKPLEVGTVDPRLKIQQDAAPAPIEMQPHAKAETQTQAPIKTPTPVAKRSVADALTKTRDSFWGRISRLTLAGDLTAGVRDELEEILLTSDLGPKTAEMLLEGVSDRLSRGEKRDLAAVKAALRDEMLTYLEKPQAHGAGLLFDNLGKAAKPAVWMMVGVNGAGKTTTIGKLASLARARGLKVMVAAGDTFRAAADSQLKVWAERSGAEIFSPDNVKDPAAVAFQALEKAKSQGVDLVLVDTAGRLHTNDQLMEELKKVKRVMAKIDPTSPHEVLIVIDANSGQNALIQARQFHQALGLTGVVVSKLDGSAKAGVTIGIAHELQIPICYIGVGEGVEDLRPFDAREFVESIL